MRMVFEDKMDRERRILENQINTQKKSFSVEVEELSEVIRDVNE